MERKAGPLKMGVAEWTMLLTLSVLWGGSFFFNALAVRDLAPLMVVAGRVMIAAAVLACVVRVLGLRWPERKVWPAFLIMGVLNNVVPFSLIVWGQTHIASGLAAILNATTPLFTAVAAHAFTADEKLTKAKVGGILLGLGGVAIMVGSDLAIGAGHDGIAQLAILAAAISYAAAGVFGRQFRRLEINPVVTAAGQVTGSALVLLPLALIFALPNEAPTPQTWAAMAGLGVLSTALAYVLFFRILSSAGATNVMLVTLLAPVVSVSLGLMILGETLQPRHGLGMALIVLALATLDGRVLQLFRSRPSA